MAAKSKGYLLLELLLAVGILAVCASAFSVRCSALQTQQHKLKVRLAAQTLAADLRQLQQQALFQAEGTQVSLTVASGKAVSYSFKSGTKVLRTITFSSLACDGVYFSSAITKLGFSKAGTPTASGSYILKHTALASYRCLLSVQPVTGRVSVYEKE